MDTFAATVACVREAHGWSRYRLARETGLSKQTIANIEDGVNSPSIKAAEKICTALGMEYTLGRKK